MSTDPVLAALTVLLMATGVIGAIATLVMLTNEVMALIARAERRASEQRSE